MDRFQKCCIHVFSLKFRVHSKEQLDVDKNMFWNDDINKTWSPLSYTYTLLFTLLAFEFDFVWWFIRPEFLQWWRKILRLKSRWRYCSWKQNSDRSGYTKLTSICCDRKRQLRWAFTHIKNNYVWQTYDQSWHFVAWMDLVKIKPPT